MYRIYFKLFASLYTDLNNGFNVFCKENKVVLHFICFTFVNISEIINIHLIMNTHRNLFLLYMRLKQYLYVLFKKLYIPLCLMSNM